MEFGASILWSVWDSVILRQKKKKQKYKKHKTFEKIDGNFIFGMHI